jgi:hypothetical protein
MAEDHAADYPVCIAEIAMAIAAPTFIGQAPGQGRNFEMIRRIGRADGSGLSGLAVSAATDVFEALRVQRLRLRHDQQVPEWDG